MLEAHFQAMASSNATVGDHSIETSTPREQLAVPDDLGNWAQTTEQEVLSESDEEYRAPHTMVIYRDKPPYLDPKGSKGRPYERPPIQEWADKLIGKIVTSEDAVGDETVSD